MEHDILALCLQRPTNKLPAKDPLTWNGSIRDITKGSFPNLFQRQNERRAVDFSHFGAKEEDGEVEHKRSFLCYLFIKSNDCVRICAMLLSTDP